MRYRMILPAVVLCSLASCARQPVSLGAEIAASQAAVASAGRVILTCYAVPACGGAAPKTSIRHAYDAAYTAVTQAQAVADGGGTPDMSLSAAAIATLEQYIANLQPVPGA